MQVGDLTSPRPMVAMASLQHFFLRGDVRYSVVHEVSVLSAS